MSTKPDPRDPARRPVSAPAPQHPEDPRSEEPEFADEPDLPPGEPSGEPTRHTKPVLPKEREP